MYPPRSSLMVHLFNSVSQLVFFFFFFGGGEGSMHGLNHPDQGLNPCPLHWEHNLNRWTTREIPKLVYWNGFSHQNSAKSHPLFVFFPLSHQLAFPQALICACKSTKILTNIMGDSPSRHITSSDKTGTAFC